MSRVAASYHCAELSVTGNRQFPTDSVWWCVTAGTSSPLNAAAIATATTGRPHRRKERIPPGAAARGAASQLLQQREGNPAAVV